MRCLQGLPLPNAHPLQVQARGEPATPTDAPPDDQHMPPDIWVRPGYIADRLPLGRIVRGLHFFGASFIVVAAVVHMLRVVLFGSYKKPREVTWITGVVLPVDGGIMAK